MGAEVVRVLLIEDDPDDVELIKDMLGEGCGAGFELVHAPDLSTGMDCLARLGPDVVILDLWLPDSSGFATLAKVFACQPEVPVIVLTGYHDGQIELEAADFGAAGCLEKARVTSDQLRRAVSEAVRRPPAPGEPS